MIPNVGTFLKISSVLTGCQITLVVRFVTATEWIGHLRRSELVICDKVGGAATCNTSCWFHNWRFRSLAKDFLNVTVVSCREICDCDGVNCSSATKLEEPLFLVSLFVCSFDPSSSSKQGKLLWVVKFQSTLTYQPWFSCNKYGVFPWVCSSFCTKGNIWCWLLPADRRSSALPTGFLRQQKQNTKCSNLLFWTWWHLENQTGLIGERYRCRISGSIGIPLLWMLW